MNILGIHCGHNSTAALMVDGRIAGAVQEERFTKRKNQVAFPLQAIRYLVAAHLGGDPSRIDKVAHATRDVDPTGLAVSRYSDFTVQDHVAEMHAYWRPIFYEGKANDGAYWRDMYRAGQRLNADHNVDADKLMSMPMAKAIRYLGDVERPRVLAQGIGWQGASETVDHHECHAYYAFYGAAIDRAHWADTLVLTADSWGDGQNWSASVVAEDGTLAKIAGGRDHGVARIYRFTTLILGMKPLEHEYKVMGLSGYTRPSKYIRDVEKIFFEALDFRDGKFVQTRPLVESYFDLKDRLEGHRFDNVASALQNWCTSITKAWVAHWLEKTGKRGLCFSGGLAMNIKTNGMLADLPALDRLSVPASGGDESTPIGAVFAVAARAKAAPEPMVHVYLGVDRADDPENDWRHGIARANADIAGYAERANVGPRELARLLAADQIVARACGPMEFGARALGNRSILANPKNPANLKRINDAIKNRDFWMPFTPSMLAEKAHLYLQIPKGIVAPFMTVGYQTTALARTEIPAALHPGDFSARPQFVSRDLNPGYWEIIDAFSSLTGVFALLNTSLNLHGDPMNRSVSDAARTVALSELAFLALPGDRLLYKVAAADKLAAILG
jgi:carbamoyltransferase